MGAAAAKRRDRPNLKVIWPLEDPFPPPKESGGGRETVHRHWKTGGEPLALHVWDGASRPADVDAIYLPDRKLWVAVRIG